MRASRYGNRLCQALQRCCGLMRVRLGGIVERQVAPTPPGGASPMVGPRRPRARPALLTALGAALALLACLCSAEAAGYACHPDGKKCCPPGWKCGGGMQACGPGGYKMPSWMYGCKGESWNWNRLPMDWSYAGYRAGEKEIPWHPQSVDVKALGAKGDGATDDTWAVEKAVAQAWGGSAVFFPPGKYVITRKIDIRKGIVLRGAGRDKTTLYFPKSLAEVYGNWGGWGHGTCFINFWGWNPVRDDQTRLATVTANSPKGSQKVFVDNPGRVQKGSWVRVVLQDSADALKSNLMGGLMEAGWPGSGARNVVRFSSRVKEVGPGGQITLERPLPWEVKTQWGPVLHAVKPSINEAGVEALTFEFKWTKYPGHLKENGYNALHMNQMGNSWVRDVRFVNADTAVYLWGTVFSTVQDVEIDVTSDRGSPTRDFWSGLDRSGHRGVWAEFGENNLFTRIAFKAPFFHDFTVATAEHGSVLSKSWGRDLNLDFHKGAPWGNLYTDLDLGAGTRAFKSGGGAGAGPNSASYQTFWNLRAAQPLQLPDNSFGPQLNFVGVQTRDSASARVAVRWMQDGGGFPQNLWLSMRQKRLGW
ncbi:MAG: pectin lyase fold/virulence factor [Monoraphidium minutum]|nr:MAG: pectin lyase fold/virulence factor [Monoraphidium minutum]